MIRMSYPDAVVACHVENAFRSSTGSSLPYSYRPDCLAKTSKQSDSHISSRPSSWAAPLSASRLARVGVLACCLGLSLPTCAKNAADQSESLSGRGAGISQEKQSTVMADARASSLSSRILDALVEANGVPGMGAAVWRGDAIAWAGSSGFRNIEQQLRVDDDTIFRLASVSKLFTATAAAKLREDGALDVSAPVGSIVKYLPKQWPPISSSQLASHTSGIPHYQPIDEARGTRRFDTVREAVGLFDDRALLFAPSERYSYSSWGYTLLSAVIEEASQRPYLDYLSEEIVPGLSVGADVTGTENTNASVAYEFADGTIRAAAPHDYSYSWGGAGLGATAPDLAHFGGRVMAGKIVSVPTLEWMLTPAKLSDGSVPMDKGSTIGFGWLSGHDGDGDRTAHHAGVTNGARSALVLYPDLHIAVSVLSNALWVSGIEQTAIMLAAPFKPITSMATVPCPMQSMSYQGEYNGKSLSGTAHVTLEDNVCTVTIGVDNVFGEWLGSFPQKDAEVLKIIGLDQDGGLSRAALVTPIGVYDLRAQPGSDRHLASLGGKSTVWIAFDAARAVSTPTAVPAQ